MNRFKREAFVKEFPFLNELGQKLDYCDLDYCEEISVGRVDTALLNSIPKQSQAVGSLVGVDSGDQVFLLAKDGGLIGKVAPDWKYYSNYAHEDGDSGKGESVLEAIYRLDCAESLRYVVWIRYGYHIRNHYSGPQWQVKIYKPAKSDILTSLLAQAQQIASDQVEAECNF